MAFDPKDPADVELLETKIAEAVDALATKNKQLLSEVKKAKAGAAIDPAEFAALEAERDGLTTQLKDAQKALKAATTAAEQATAALESEAGFNRGLLVDNGVNAALLEAGVKDPVLLKAAAALLKGSAKIEVKVDGATRVAMVGDKALAAHIKEWSQGDEGKTFVAAPGNGGGGAPGAGAPGTGGGQTAVKANMSGTPAERQAAIAAQLGAMNLTPAT